MEPNKILSARLIDVIFDDRNKDYGAYHLRNTYARRIKKALLVTIAVAATAVGGATLADSFKKEEPRYRISDGIVLKEIPDEKKPEKLPEPKQKRETEPTRTQRITPPVILPDTKVEQPLTAIDDSARIDVVDRKGKPDIHETTPPATPGNDPAGILTPKVEKDPEAIQTTVDVPAKFIGNWIGFLERNLDPEVPVNNGAAAGRYSVVVQFVVDKEGKVSDVKALTGHGYGVEEEAVRVIKKAPKWQPAIQAGYVVKAYHRQVIVFEVLE